MSKHKQGKHYRGSPIQINLIPGKGKLDHKPQAKSPAGRAVDEAETKDQEAKDKDQAAQVKAGLTLTTNDKGQTKATDSKGQEVLTKEDQTKIDKTKASQIKARELTRLAREATRQAKLDLEELSSGGSGAVKALLQELQAKIKDQETKTEALRDDLKTELASLNDLYAEYKSLTGLDKSSGDSGKVKAKSGKANGNGRFTATIKANGSGLKILVTHTETKSLFETSLYPKNGTIKVDDWLALRHRFVAHFEAKDKRRKVDRSVSGKDYDLVLRAYLSNLKGKVEAIKPIL